MVQYLCMALSKMIGIFLNEAKNIYENIVSKEVLNNLTNSINNNK